MRRFNRKAIVFAALSSVFASVSAPASADIRTYVPNNWVEMSREAAHVFAAPDDQSVVIVQYYPGSDQEALAAQILSALRVSDEADRSDMVLRDGEDYHRSCIGERAGETAIIQVSVIPHLSGGFVTVTGIMDPGHVMRDAKALRSVVHETSRLSRYGYDLHLPGLVGFAEPVDPLGDIAEPGDASESEMTLASVSVSEAEVDPAGPLIPEPDPEPVPEPIAPVIATPPSPQPEPQPDPAETVADLIAPEPTEDPAGPISGFVTELPSEAVIPAVTAPEPIVEPAQPAPSTPSGPLSGLHIGSNGLQDVKFYEDGSFTEIGYVPTSTAISGLDGKQGGSGVYSASATSITLTYADGQIKSGTRDGGVISMGGGTLEKLGG